MNIRTILEQPANSVFLKVTSGKPPLEMNPELIHRATNFYPFDLGTHPDLVKHLWTKLTSELPTACAYVIYHRPVLIHPKGVIFANVGGTSTGVIRFPPTLRQELIESKRASTTYDYPNVTLKADNWGTDWLFITRIFGDPQLPALIRQAYDYADTLAIITPSEEEAAAPTENE